MPVQVDSQLQEGIYFQTKAVPGSAYRLVLLNVRSDAALSKVRDALEAVWTKLGRLQKGLVDDVEGDVPDERVRDGQLTRLLGFGASLFARYGKLPRPAELEALGDGPFNSLRWDASDRRAGEADIAIQLIAMNEAAVSRAVAEIWMLTQPPSAQPLDLVAVHQGFQRDDGRSWIGFHDAVNNIPSAERRDVIEVRGGDVPWMEGGTFMAFLRLGLDLTAWRALDAMHQEVIVGREKQTGCPLARVDPHFDRVPMAGCTGSKADQASASYKNPPLPGPEQSDLRMSHMHRANLNRQSPSGQPLNNRIYRQGYEFLESPADGRLRMGLNFVSFQKTLGQLQRILHLPGWLGDTNFGGPPNGGTVTPGGAAPLQIISVIAGGYYAVPPSGQPFPGASLF